MIAVQNGKERPLSRTRRDMIEAAGRLAQMLGLPRSTGQIYGLLYLSAKPLSLDGIVELLGISKASASGGTRQLMAWRAIRPVWIPGERRDYFEAEAEIGRLLLAAFRDFVQPRLASSTTRLEAMLAALDEERGRQLLTDEEYDVCRRRVRDLSRLQKKLEALLPLAEKLV